MSYLDVIATVQTPVTANGAIVQNRNGEAIAMCDNSFMATAIADLINKGVPAAEAEGVRHAERQQRLADLVNKSLAPYTKL
jgi:hypothetical protein